MASRRETYLSVGSFKLIGIVFYIQLGAHFVKFKGWPNSVVDINKFMIKTDRIMMRIIDWMS